MSALTTSSSIGLRVIGLFLLAGQMSGCGTLNTLTSPGKDTPLIYSGTRLDIAALSNNEAALKEFDVEPPAHPGIDLPASFVLDTAVLSITLFGTGFRKLAW